MTLFFHSNITNGDFSDGFMHPLTGFDHLLAMLCVGVISTFLDRKHIFLLPAAFVFSMLLGGLLGLRQIPVYFTEQLISLSVLILGLLILQKNKLNLSLVYFITLLFGLAHGYAHGIEIPFSSSPVFYFVGFLSATAIIHILGIVLGEKSKQITTLNIAKTFGLITLLSGIVLIFQKF